MAELLRLKIGYNKINCKNKHLLYNITVCVELWEGMIFGEKRTDIKIKKNKKYYINNHRNNSCGSHYFWRIDVCSKQA